MKPHKHNWKRIETAHFDLIMGELIIYYICEECERYKKLRLKEI